MRQKRALLLLRYAYAPLCATHILKVKSWRRANQHSIAAIPCVYTTQEYDFDPQYRAILGLAPKQEAAAEDTKKVEQ